MDNVAHHEYALPSANLTSGIAQPETTKPTIVPLGVDYPCDLDNVATDLLATHTRDENHPGKVATVCVEQQPRSETSYQGRPDIVALKESIDTLWATTPPDKEKDNGKFSVFNETWGQAAVFAASNGKSDVELTTAIHAERQRLIAVTQSEPYVRDLTIAALNLSESLPPHIQHKIVGSNRPANDTELLNRLVSTDSDGTYLVPDPVVLDAIAAHAQNIVSRQQEFDTTLAPHYKDRFLRAAANASVPHDGQQGWLSRHALQNINSRLPHYRALVDDGLMTEGREMTAFARKFDLIYSDGHILPAYRVIFSPAGMDAPHTPLHELAHALLEGDGPNGLLYTLGIFGPDAGVAAAAVTESITDHTALSLNAGELLDTHEVISGNYRLGYPSGSKLLHVLSTQGTHPVGIQSFIDASWENYAQRTNAASATVRLYCSLRTAFPFCDVTRDIGRLLPASDEVHAQIVSVALDDYTRYLERKSKQ